MARVRRKAAAATRFNFELAGIAALGLALLLALALVLPPGRSGAAGSATASALHAVFGAAAGWFPALIALVGAIVFLEINVPKMIATLGAAAVGFFIIIDTALGMRGGALGRALDSGVAALVGDIGEKIVLVVVALSIAVWITNVSLKKVIGWCIARVMALRPPQRRNGHASEASARPAPAAGPRTLREAFHLPALGPKPARNAVATVAAPASTADLRGGAGPATLIRPAQPAAVVYDAMRTKPNTSKIPTTRISRTKPSTTRTRLTLMTA